MKLLIIRESPSFRNGRSRVPSFHRPPVLGATDVPSSWRDVHSELEGAAGRRGGGAAGRRGTTAPPAHPAAAVVVSSSLERLFLRCRCGDLRALAGDRQRRRRSTSCFTARRGRARRRCIAHGMRKRRPRRGCPPRARGVGHPLLSHRIAKLCFARADRGSGMRERKASLPAPPRCRKAGYPRSRHELSRPVIRARVSPLCRLAFA